MHYLSEGKYLGAKGTRPRVVQKVAEGETSCARVELAGKSDERQ